MRRKQRVFNLWPVLGILLIALASIAACDDKQAMEQQSPVDITGYTTGSTPTLSLGIIYLCTLRQSARLC